MRPGIYHTIGRILVRHVVAVFPGIKSKLKHLHTRITGCREKFTDAVGQKAEILSDNLLLTQNLINLVKKLDSRSFFPGTVYRCLFSVGNGIIFIKATKMVNSNHVIPGKAILNTGKPPGKSRFLMIGPIV